jgi:hypothetical protein
MANMQPKRISNDIIEVGIARFIDKEAAGKLKDHSCTKKAGTIDFDTDGKPGITYDYRDGGSWEHDGISYQGSIHQFLRWYEGLQ